MSNTSASARYLTVFTNKKMLVTWILGFSGGLPLALTGATLQAWLTKAGLDVATIGLFALVGIPYSLKFLWAPLMDSKPLPFLGLRRGWMVTTQVGLFLSTLALGFMDPTSQLTLLSLVALSVAFFSASQDIVIDAYRTEIIADKAELGAASGTYITGYRIAMLVSGGAALILADHMSWAMVYGLMAVINLVGMAAILMSEEPQVTRSVKVGDFQESVTLPFIEFFQRPGAMEILIFIMVYKLSTLMATALTTKFLLDLQYTMTSIGSVNKVAGLIATICGTLVGGSLMVKLGLKRSLWIFGVVQSLVGFTFCALAYLASHETLGAFREFWLIATISMDNFMMGLGTAALTGFMMSIVSRQFTGTQMALLTSVMAVARVILIAHAGTLVAGLGWTWFFIATVPLALPGLLLLSRFDHWQSGARNVSTRIPAFDVAMIVGFVVSLVCMSSDPVWRLIDMKDFGGKVVLAGAIGVCAVVAISLLRPLFAGARQVKTA